MIELGGSGSGAHISSGSFSMDGPSPAGRLEVVDAGVKWVPDKGSEVGLKDAGCDKTVGKDVGAICGGSTPGV